MKRIFEDIFIKNYPTLDLHGCDRDTAAIMVNDFISDNHKLHNKDIVIIHGIGSGILKNTVHNTLKINNLVSDYKLHHFNIGMTIVKIE
ncbi:MAG: Smr/MutS family protein [Bacilli bacterium]|nr:Smr/MutS family protein [Bacilli bacterium]MDD4298922.1 Smr/MutS family protein [Bacilli bacterium]